MMFTPIKGIDVPLVSVGTSPFFGAGQFGRKAREYRRKFLHDADAILEILRASYNAGGRGIQLVPGGKINEAASVMKESYDDFVITGSTFPGADPKIDQLVDLGAKIIFAHGSVSDRQDERLIKMIDDISSRGVLSGVALHSPIETLEFIVEQELHVDTILVPFNAKGLFMGDQKRLEEMVDQLNQYSFIGMKTLAAGKLEPQKAYSYIQKHNICAVTIGMVSTQQANESTQVALNVLKKE
jgi:putative N-acetylmannosamine-6-phosphate epimerase